MLVGFIFFLCLFKWNSIDACLLCITAYPSQCIIINQLMQPDYPEQSTENHGNLWWRARYREMSGSICTLAFDIVLGKFRISEKKTENWFGGIQMKMQIQVHTIAECLECIIALTFNNAIKIPFIDHYWWFIFEHIMDASCNLFAHSCCYSQSIYPGPAHWCTEYWYNKFDI